MKIIFEIGSMKETKSRMKTTIHLRKDHLESTNPSFSGSLLLPRVFEREILGGRRSIDLISVLENKGVNKVF